MFAKLFTKRTNIFLLGTFSAGVLGVASHKRIHANENAKDIYSSFANWNNENLPIIYSPNYNITFFGLEKIHPFDSCKYRNIVNILEQKEILKQNQLIEPTSIPSQDILLKVHSQDYLSSLRYSFNVARISEISFLAFIPNFIVKKRVLNPMLYATSGSIIAGKVALERGWSINLSGGYHHCSSHSGGGFCAFADAHQGNGHERDKLNFEDKELYILDIYNKDIYPKDEYAKSAIDLKVELKSETTDSVYLGLLENSLEKAFTNFKPDFIIYNAGTDILEGDPLGWLDITPDGVVKRDEFVFKSALSRKIPIAMFLSGGYQASNAKVIAQSIENLKKKYSLF